MLLPKKFKVINVITRGFFFCFKGFVFFVNLFFNMVEYVVLESKT